MNGIIGGALVGLGGGLSTVARDMNARDVAAEEEQKQVRLRELDAKYRVADRADAASLAKEQARYNAELADKPRQQILTEAAKGRVSAVPDGRDMPGAETEVVADTSPERMGIIAGRLGYPAIQGQYRRIVNDDLTEAEKLKQQGEQAERLKAVAPGESTSQTAVHNAYAKELGERGPRADSVETRRSQEEERRAREGIDKDARETARLKMQTGQILLKTYETEKDKFDKKWSEVGFNPAAVRGNDNAKQADKDNLVQYDLEKRRIEKGIENANRMITEGESAATGSPRRSSGGNDAATPRAPSQAAIDLLNANRTPENEAIFARRYNLSSDALAKIGSPSPRAASASAFPAAAPRTIGIIGSAQPELQEPPGAEPVGGYPNTTWGRRQKAENDRLRSEAQRTLNNSATVY